MTILSAALLLSLLASPGRAAAAADGAERPWTFLVYGAADNDADGPMLAFLDRLRKALDDDPGVELVVLVDRHPEFSSDATLFGEDFAGTRLYRLRKDSALRLSGDAELAGVLAEGDAELDTSDPMTLGLFVAWGKRRFPAQRTGLLIYSHADGRTMCPDETTEGEMGIPALSRHLGADLCLDFLALELCNMGGIEIAYQWRPAQGGEAPRFGADVLVAIPNAGPPLDWDRAFARIASPGHAVRGGGEPVDPAAMTAADFAHLVVEEGRRGREHAAAEGAPVEHEAAAAYDLRKAGPAKRAVDALAAALARAGAKEPFLRLRDPGNAELLNYARRGPFVDVVDLCERVARGEEFPAEVREAARAAAAAADELVLASFGMSAYEGFVPGRNGLFLVFPANEPGIWREFAWYTPLAGPDPGVSGGWDFLGDGGEPGNGVVETWFELLDAWLDEADGGGRNGYRP